MTPHSPKTCMASFGVGEILNQTVPITPGVTFERVAASPGSRIVVARRCSRVVCSLDSYFFLLETQHATRHIAAAGPIPPQPRSTPSLNGEGCKCGAVVGCAPPRAPPQWPGVSWLFTTTTMALTALRNARAGSCRRADDGPT